MPSFSKCRAWLARVGVLSTFLVLSLATASSAMRVSPMVVELATSGAGSVARIEVGNAGSAAMPFETIITRIDFNEDGTLVETLADDEFLVFPPQGLVAVGGRQIIRVQWVGPPDLTASRAYYLQVNQLPVATETDPDHQGAPNLAVTILYSMKVLMVIAPPGAEPSVEVTSVTPSLIMQPAPPPVETAPGAPPAEALPPVEVPGVTVTVVNTGSRYALMSGATWHIEGTAEDGQAFARRYDAGEISQILGVGYVAPETGRRTFSIPTGTPLAASRPVTVRFSR